ncbi:hypothetical protein [Longispora albida]|uniref:hypothetical protein n=1 Tax=Longispora albida TaxID=203523 RepID=UPI00035D140C|nr:hypothetical protein [Longispora albida]
MTGFPTGQFRLVNVETGLCMYIHKYSLNDSPMVGMQKKKGVAEELWRFDGRLINTSEVGLLGTFGLRADRDLDFLTTRGTGSELCSKWEHKNGIISCPAVPGVMTCLKENFNGAVGIARANGTTPPIRAAIQSATGTDDADTWLDEAPDYELRHTLAEMTMGRQLPGVSVIVIQKSTPAELRALFKKLLAEEASLPPLNQQWRCDPA